MGWMRWRSSASRPIAPQVPARLPPLPGWRRLVWACLPISCPCRTPALWPGRASRQPHTRPAALAGRPSAAPCPAPCPAACPAAADAELATFLQEARLLARLHHRHIVQVFFGLCGGGALLRLVASGSVCNCRWRPLPGALTSKLRVVISSPLPPARQYYGACLEPGSLMIVTELMKGGQGGARGQGGTCAGGCCAEPATACHPPPPPAWCSHDAPCRLAPCPLPPGGDLYRALRRHPDAMRWERLGRKVRWGLQLRARAAGPPGRPAADGVAPC